jgi:hypothetical protein
MSVISIISVVLLLVIAAELASIIYKVQKNLSQAEGHLTSAQDRLIKAQEQWTQICGGFISNLCGPSGADAGESRIALHNNQNQTLERLNQTLSTLSSTLPQIIATNKQGTDSVDSRVAETVEALHEEVGKLFNVCANFVQDFAKERKQLFQELEEHVGSHRAQLRALANSLAASIDQTKQRAVTSLPSDGVALEVVQSNDLYEPALQNPPEEPTSQLTPNDVSKFRSARELDAADEDDQRFRNLRQWVTENLDHIMRRSLARWSMPGELTFDAPRELSLKTTLLDPDSKMMLLGTAGHQHYLAVALPGGYIGSTFFDWFTIPKGTNVRVERTVTPALVAAGSSGYVVVERGVVAQD